MKRPPLPTLRIGFAGAGGIARSHLRSLLGVRNTVVTGVFSPTPERRAAFADEVRAQDLGDCIAYPSLQAMLESGSVDAVWLLGPNDTRVPMMQTVHDSVLSGRTALRAVACEKPLARTLGEAKQMCRLAEAAGLLHGYLENMVFSTAIQRGHEVIWRRAVPASGRPFVVRVTEEHAGPRSAWFWQGGRHGGGVLLDMMSHSVEIGRRLLTGPQDGRVGPTLVSATATVATLNWSRSGQGKGQAEDFARGLLVLRDPDQHEAMIEATVSWIYVGPGLGTRVELLGPDYSMEFNVQNTGLKVFLGRDTPASAEGQGLLPLQDDTSNLYGYTPQNRHFVEAFRRGEMPDETFEDGVSVMHMLMALYRSAELGRTVQFADEDLDHYLPPTASA